MAQCPLLEHYKKILMGLILDYTRMPHAALKCALQLKDSELAGFILYYGQLSFDMIIFYYYPISRRYDGSSSFNASNSSARMVIWF